MTSANTKGIKAPYTLTQMSKIKTLTLKTYDVQEDYVTGEMMYFANNGRYSEDYIDIYVEHPYNKNQVVMLTRQEYCKDYGVYTEVQPHNPNKTIVLRFYNPDPAELSAIDYEREISNILSREILKEIDRAVIREVMKAAEEELPNFTIEKIDIKPQNHRLREDGKE